MKTKEKQPLTNEWERIFKVLPVKTEDGFRVILGYVWRMNTDDPFEPVRYHTNPENKEYLFQEEKAKRIRAKGGYQPIGSNYGPPRKRPPPPPPPPQPRKIGGSVMGYKEILKAWDEHERVRKAEEQKAAIKRIFEIQRTMNKRRL